MFSKLTVVLECLVVVSIQPLKVKLLAGQPRICWSATGWNPVHGAWAKTAWVSHKAESHWPFGNSWITLVSREPKK